MAGWRLGYCVGNPEMIQALTRIKSYLDYGVFQPIQIAGIIALNEEQDPASSEIVDTYKVRRDALVNGPEPHRLGGGQSPRPPCSSGPRFPSVGPTWARWSSARCLIREAKVAVSPGLGFGEYGDDFVRFALVENEQRINQAIRGLRRFFQTAE